MYPFSLAVGNEFLVEGEYVILDDPPYSQGDAEHYGLPMVNRNKVIREAAKCLEKGCSLFWLDQVLPMYSKKDLKLAGTIGTVRSTNHRFRVACIFERV